ncbi:MAG TPA: hypothetical protein VGS05_08140 [Candidatus Sulfotelmatobacter sp.]|nr:hypothetical protein [Candidatus Sulfotelmatobacter sp.]
MNRLAVALIAYAVLGVLTWMTISDPRVRAVPLAILVLFAVKSWLRRNDVMHPDKAEDEASRDSAESRQLKADGSYEPM